jgi:hypothetical protein
MEITIDCYEILLVMIISCGPIIVVSGSLLIFSIGYNIYDFIRSFKWMKTPD